MNIGDLSIANFMVGDIQVDKLCLGTEVVWENTPPVPPTPEYSAMPLTFEIISGGTIKWKSESNYFAGETIQYSLNGGNWTTITANTTGVSINVSAGDTVRILGNRTNRGCNFYGSTAILNIYGNIMSIAYGSNYEGQTVISAGSPFKGLFQSLNVISAEHLIIPATTLTNECCASMFANCTSLTTAPALPATTLAGLCYQFMFSECTSLTSAPALPATTLADLCYQFMFAGCTSLTSAPALPATTLAPYCYRSMFRDCTSLTTAPALPATTLANSCYSNMFYGCTSLTTAPELPATTLADDCYREMFFDCTSLTAITCLATDIWDWDGCVDDWVNGVAENGTFTKHPDMEYWDTGESGIPDGWTVQDAVL